VGFVMAVTAAAADSARPSPPFSILRTGATPIRLSQYRGKVVALAFIQTTCSHCQQFTTILNILAREYAPRGVQFLECAFNDDAVVTMPEFLERFAPPYPVGYSSQAAVMTYLQRSIIDPRPVYVPHVVFLDRAGIIRAEAAGQSEFFRNPEASMRVELEKLLKGVERKK